jgi:bacillolysin
LRPFPRGCSMKKNFRTGPGSIHRGLILSANALLACSLLLAGKAAIGQQPDAAIAVNLVPLPGAIQPEIPFTAFRALTAASPVIDPAALQTQNQLKEFLGNSRVRQAWIAAAALPPQPRTAAGINTALLRLSIPASAMPQRQPKKPLSGGISSVLSPGMPAAFQSSTITAGAASLAAADNLEFKMRPIGTPRQITVVDKGAVTGALPQLNFVASATDTDESKVRAFLNRYRAYLRLDDPDSELSLIRRETDDLNRQHFRFAQSYRGLAVWPAEVLVHLDADGNIDLVDGAFVPTPSTLDIQPKLNAGDAAHTARNSISGAVNAEIGTPELMIYGALDKPARLAWKMKANLSLDERWTVVVDALNGEVLAALSDVQHEKVVGSGQDLKGITRPLNLWRSNGLNYMVDTGKAMFDATSIPPNPDATRGAIIVTDARNLPATSEPQSIPSLNLVTSGSANSGWLRDAVSAAFNFSNVYDYYFARFGRNSINGQGGNINATVRLGRNFNNAFWSTELNSMFFGDAMPFAGALDVVGHELTHGVTAYSANLIYHNQPGALNEAFSDIFGEMVEAYAQGATDWTIGGDLGSPFRSLKNPSAISTTLGPYPSKMSEYYRLADSSGGDYGGVHINSSIINHAYYLLAEGLTGAIGIKDAERIFYRALTTHLTRQSEFIDARLACIQSATELFGAGSPQAVKTAEAFSAVEIHDAAATPTPNPGNAVSGPDSSIFVSFDPNYGFFGSFRLARRETTLGDGTLGYWLSQSAVKNGRPSVTADGTLAVFVKSNNDLCLMLTNDATSEECLGQPGFVHSVAMSPDGDRFGFVMLDNSGDPENRITVLDLGTNTTRVFPLLAPATEGISIDSIAYADAMVFTTSGRFLIYDALNIIKLADGSNISAWSIYALDRVTGQTLTVVTPRQGVNIGYPAIGHTSDDFITFEASAQSTGQSTLFAGNLRTGKVAAVGTVNNDYGVPGFTGDDGAITYSVPDVSVWTGHSIYRRPLAADHMTPSGSPALWVQDGDFGITYRRGSYHKLTVNNDDTGSGVIVSDTGGIHCGDVCSYLYPSGTTVNLTASPFSGATFGGWGGGCGGTGTCSLVLNQDQSVSAAFRGTVSYALTVGRVGSGSGLVTSNPAGIDCGTDCSENYAGGTSVTLTASAASGSRFAGWSGACAGTGTCQVLMNQAQAVTANFQSGSGPGAPPAADLSLKLGAAKSVKLRRTLTYTFTVKNSSKVKVTDLVITGHLAGAAAGATSFVRMPAYCGATGPALTCRLNALAGKARKVFTVIVKPRGRGVLDFSANVAGFVNDPKAGNNRAAVATKVK